MILHGVELQALQKFILLKRSLNCNVKYVFLWLFIFVLPLWKKRVGSWRKIYDVFGPIEY